MKKLQYPSGAVRSVDQHTDVELMLEDFATEHEDLADSIEELQDGVSTHRLLEQVKLSNERNRIMRVELLLSFSMCSLGIMTAVAGFFGMNLHSGCASAEAAWLPQPSPVLRSLSRRRLWAFAPRL